MHLLTQELKDGLSSAEQIGLHINDVVTDHFSCKGIVVGDDGTPTHVLWENGIVTDIDRIYNYIQAGNVKKTNETARVQINFGTRINEPL